MIEAADPARYKRLAAEAGVDAARRLAFYRHLSEWKAPGQAGTEAAETPAKASA
jgi:hypothetical protein